MWGERWNSPSNLSVTYLSHLSTLLTTLNHVQQLQLHSVTERRQHQLRYLDGAGYWFGSLSGGLLLVPISLFGGNDLTGHCGLDALCSWVILSTIPVHPG